MIEQGEPLITKVKQVDSSYVVKNDGTIEASLTFIVDKESISDFPAIDDDHPEDVRLQCYNRTLTYGNNNLVTCACSYFGIAVEGDTKKTEPVISYDAGTNQEPIETHPRWNLVGGTPGAPKNGAQYDEDTGQFLGFQGDDAGDLLGVQYYLTPSANFSMTYWTTGQPDLERRLKIVKDPEIGKKLFPRIPTVKNFLMVDMPYRKIGNLYQVTEQYMGSGERGWNEEIYKLMPKG
jgi:hypothetical protein